MQLPARIDAPPAFNPEFLRWFAPGEQVIWHGRSRGFNFTGQQFVILAIYLAIAAGPVWIWLFIPDADHEVQREIALAAIGFIWIIGLVHTWWRQVTAPFMAEVVLTDRRLYLRTGIFRRHIRRLGGPRDKLSRRIQMLRLTGPAQRPLLKLRGFLANSTGIVVLRVADGRKLAELIHDTLEPGIPIRDRTTGHAISAR